MFIIYKNQGCREYASAAISKRVGKTTSMTYTYLGLVIDKDKGIYKNRERGVFSFDAETGQYSAVPESFVPTTIKDMRKRECKCVDFGDAYFVDRILWDSGLIEVVNSIEYGNRDTLHAMILFYILSVMSNCDAINWWEGSIAKMLYPNANLSSQRISDFLRSIGKAENKINFQIAYVSFLKKHYDSTFNILIDSTGLTSSIKVPFTQISNHNGKISREIRLIFVVQKMTGIPIFYMAIPGNIIDVSTMSRVFAHLDALEVPIHECLLDAGYNSASNLDMFYDENHKCKIGYITRVKVNDTDFQQMVKESLPTLESKENFVQYQDRYLFITKKKVMVGENKDNPAYLYLGLDCSRLTDEQHKLFKKAKKTKMKIEDVFDAMQCEGLFGIVSGNDYPCEEILPAYYYRQNSEQMFDFAKNYTKLLPLRVHTMETFHGHLLLAFIASCVVKMIQNKLKTEEMYLGSRLTCMRNQKCMIYSGKIITEPPQKIANDSYEAFKIDCPVSIPIVNNRLQINYHIETDKPSLDIGPKKKKSKNSTKNKSKQKERSSSLSDKLNETIPNDKQTATITIPTEKRKRGRPPKGK